jgi:hypothetical protein
VDLKKELLKKVDPKKALRVPVAAANQEVVLLQAVNLQVVKVLQEEVVVPAAEKVPVPEASTQVLIFLPVLKHQKVLPVRILTSVAECPVVMVEWTTAMLN